MPRVGDPAQEPARLAALDACQILDTAQESCFDALTHQAAEACDTPVALVSLVDEKRQWFKSRVGFSAIETPREFSFCSRAIETPDQPMIVEDATRDPRFSDNPLVVGDPHIRFYAGVPLVTRDGHALGTLCVIDQKPRTLEPAQLARLGSLAEHARAQLELRRAFRDLSRLTETLEQRAAELRATNEALEAFAYSASHDLRAPLRRIGLLATDVVADEAEHVAPQSATNLSRIQTEADRLSKLVDDLLQLGHTTTSELSPSFVDLAAVATEIDDRLRSRHPEREVEFKIEGEMTARGDPTLLRVALMNLIDNAWKYTARKHHAVITLHADHAQDGTLIISLADNGVGFDPAEAKGSLFVPFHRLHKAEEFSGTGVGLATVRRVVERHGGRIWAEAEPGKGATFRFTLPAAAPIEHASTDTALETVRPST